MSFTADKQTLDDLNLLGKYRQHSIYNIFSKVHTNGGERLLQEMFQNPLTSPESINQRSGIFSYFQERNLKFPLENETFSVMENYLGDSSGKNYVAVVVNTLRRKVTGAFLRDEQYNILHDSLLATIKTIHALTSFAVVLEDKAGNPYEEDLMQLKSILSDKRLSWVAEEQGKATLSVMKVVRYDYLLRHVLHEQMTNMLEKIYALDVYITVSEVSRSNNFSYATAVSAERNLIKTTALRHPGLVNGVANPLTLNRDSNMLFLTGANMAGKSTFMKSFGIAVYLAHMGFPVAAKDMTFSVLDGLYSSINVADNLNMGYSHFYAEVLRVKKVAEEVSRQKKLVVLFDELFKGTNVKDAYDATLSVTKAFSGYRNCFYIISTHIIEVGEALQKQCNNIEFSFMPTVMEGTTPRYTYQRSSGITSDRHGMMIIKNEQIPEMLKD